MFHQEAESLRRVLDQDWTRLDPWLALGRLHLRAGRGEPWVPRRLRRELRTIMRREPGCGELRSLLAGAWSAEALAGPDLPEAWAGSREVGWDPEVPYHRREGVPLGIRHRATGMELRWIPRVVADLRLPWPNRALLHEMMARFGTRLNAPVEPGGRRQSLATYRLDAVACGGGYLGRFPVTAGQWARFLEEVPGGPRPRRWREQSRGAPGVPVTGVSQDKARAFCSWMGGRLPDEATWEYAGRGGDTREYPWGAEADLEDGVLATRMTRMAALPLVDSHGALRDPPTGVVVGSAPGSSSPFGIEEMSGHVGEWMDTEGVQRGGVVFQWTREEGAWIEPVPPRDLGTGSRVAPAPLWLRKAAPAHFFGRDGEGLRVWIPVDAPRRGWRAFDPTLPRAARLLRFPVGARAT